jgi:hypothetical protein
VPPLRDLLARRVEDARAAAREQLPRTGWFSALEDQPKIVFATRGRVTGLRRERWWLPFAPDGDVLYLLEERGRDAGWVRNVLADPHVEVDGGHALARIVDDPDEVARARLLCAERFARRGLLVADLVERGLVIAFERDHR